MVNCRILNFKGTDQLSKQMSGMSMTSSQPPMMMSQQSMMMQQKMMMTSTWIFSYCLLVKNFKVQFATCCCCDRSFIFLSPDSVRR